MSPVPAALSFAGIAKESSKGTGVSPTVYIPLKTINPEDMVAYLPVEVLKGSMAQVYGDVQGYKHTTFEAAGPVFPDTVGWFLAGVLGDVTTTASRAVTDGVLNSTTTVTSATAAFVAGDVGKSISGTGIPSGAFILSVTNSTTAIMSVAATATASSVSVTIGAPQTHAMSLKNSGDGQPTAHTLTDFYSATQARQYAGMQWHEVGLKFTAEGLLEHSSKGTGLVASAQVSKPTQSFSTVTPVPVWQGMVVIGGSLQSLTVDGEITITRQVEVVEALTGTQQAISIFLGAATAKWKFTAVMNDDTELTRMLSDTKPQIDFNFCAGTGASAAQLDIRMTQAAYEKAKINRGKAYVAIDCEGQGIANTTDVGSSGGYGMCKILLGNSVAASTYV